MACSGYLGVLCHFKNFPFPNNFDYIALKVYDSIHQNSLTTKKRIFEYVYISPPQAYTFTLYSTQSNRTILISPVRHYSRKPIQPLFSKKIKDIMSETAIDARRNSTSSNNEYEQVFERYNYDDYKAEFQFILEAMKDITKRTTFNVPIINPDAAEVVFLFSCSFFSADIQLKQKQYKHFCCDFS